jgi:uncharacterized protein
MAGEKFDIDFLSISKDLKAFRFPEADYIVGIATGGTYPAILIAHQLGLPCRFIHLNFRNPDNTPVHEEPVFLHGDITDIPKGSKVLLVDEVSVSGKTIDKALDLLKDFHVKTFVLKGKGDFVLYPDIRTCVNWPWKIQS